MSDHLRCLFRSIVVRSTIWRCWGLFHKTNANYRDWSMTSCSYPQFWHSFRGMIACSLFNFPLMVFRLNKNVFIYVALFFKKAIQKRVHFAKSYNGACLSEIYHAFMSFRYTFYSLFKNNKAKGLVCHPFSFMAIASGQ